MLECKKTQAWLELVTRFTAEGFPPSHPRDDNSVLDKLFNCWHANLEAGDADAAHLSRLRIIKHTNALFLPTIGNLIDHLKDPRQKDPFDVHRAMKDHIIATLPILQRVFDIPSQPAAHPLASLLPAAELG